MNDKNDLKRLKQNISNVLLENDLMYNGKQLVDKTTGTRTNCSLRGIFGEELFRNKNPSLHDVEYLNKLIALVEFLEGCN